MRDTSHIFAEWVALSHYFQLDHMYSCPTPQPDKETIMIVMNIPLCSSNYAGNILDSFSYLVFPRIISSGLGKEEVMP